mmetsp:Transcript_19177/g.26917  ORF Transcript_19177/g.26917 Transcript_19177/m.26917 type:complete len:171 (+) Transcript_19177:31-543(+)
MSVSSNNRVVSNPTLIERNHLRFLIMDAPTNANVDAYVEMLKKKKVSCVVRACDATYSTEPYGKAGIRLVDLPFADGDPPPKDVVDRWLDTVEAELPKKSEEKTAVAVHCVAGLGRAPVLVAIALVENGMEPYDVIAYIRKRRRGAINQRQLEYIEGYKKKRATGCCIVM